MTGRITAFVPEQARPPGGSSGAGNEISVWIIAGN